jgi:hypothetical protein
MSFNSKAYLEYEEMLYNKHGQSPQYGGKSTKNISRWYAAQIELQKAIDSVTPEEWAAEIKREQEKFRNNGDD